MPGVSEGGRPGSLLPSGTSFLPASPNIPSRTAAASGTAPGHTRNPPTGTVRRGENWSRSRNKTAYSAAERTTLNAILCCRSFSCSGYLASSRPFWPKAPDRWCVHHWVSLPSALWLRRRELAPASLHGLVLVGAPQKDSQTRWSTTTTGTSKKRQREQRRYKKSGGELHAGAERKLPLVSANRACRGLRCPRARQTRAHGVSRTRSMYSAGKARSRDMQQNSAPWTVITVTSYLIFIFTFSCLF